ncbi:MAG: hypothetical protein J7456_08615, partial [Chloroflexus sp.]|nr:hypothetical protein [Chloroflexus sp.]
EKGRGTGWQAIFWSSLAVRRADAMGRRDGYRHHPLTFPLAPFLSHQGERKGNRLASHLLVFTRRPAC